MQTVETSRLYFKDDRSNKVYEVDLCTTAPDKYVVNFRYGRNGSRLIEGTKTVFPVAFEEAKKIFNQLVESKVKKGYLASGEAHAPAQEEVEPIVESSNSTSRNTERDAVIARYLKQMVSDSYVGLWSSSRVIYRAGVIRVPGVEGDLARLLPSSKDMDQYSIVWSLTRLGSSAGHEQIFSLLSESSNSPSRRLAQAHLLHVRGPRTNEVIVGLKSALPSLLREVVLSANENQLQEGIGDLIKSPNKTTPGLLVNLYLLSSHSPTLRTAMRRLVESLNVGVNTFKAIRQIYKISEMIEDWDMLAICGKQIAISPIGYSSRAYYTQSNHQYIRIAEEKTKEEPRIAFSSGTKHYLSNRLNRSLRAQEEEGEANYRSLAKSILLSIDDEKDRQIARKEGKYVYIDRWQFVEQYYPKYDTHKALMTILYGQSNRFASTPDGGRAAYFAPGQHGRLESETPREETRPEYWDNAPRDIIDILAGSRAEQVSDFALKVFKANPAFKSSVSGADFKGLLTSFHHGTVSHFLDVVKDMIVRGMPVFDIVLALLSSENEEVFALGEESLIRYAAVYLADSKNVAALLCNGRLEIMALFFSESVTPVSGTRLALQELKPLIDHEYDYTDDNYQAVSAVIRSEKWSSHFADISLSEIAPLLQHQRDGVVQFALSLCTVNSGQAHTLVGDAIDAHLASEHAGVRSTAVALLNKFPNEYLVAKGSDILSFAFSTYPEVRENVVPVILRLINLDKDRRADFYQRLIASISGSETSPGIHEDHLRWLNDHFAPELETIDQETVFSLLLSDVDAAQKIGYKAYTDKGMRAKLGIEEWVRLGDCDVVAIREAIGEYFNSNVDAVNRNLESSLKVLNAKWMDVRHTAFDYFLDKTESSHWTLELVLMVIDNPREDVQAFGRSLISRLFSAEEGRQLMLHMSEHPSRSMMLFTSNYLELHAKDNPEIVVQLAQYFKNILFGVNTGAAAKTRVFAFLSQESEKSRAVAEMSTQLFGEIMATVSMKDKDRCLTALLDIRKTYPEVELPFTIHPVKSFQDAV